MRGQRAASISSPIRREALEHRADRDVGDPEARQQPLAIRRQARLEIGVDLGQPRAELRRAREIALLLEDLRPHEVSNAIAADHLGHPRVGVLLEEQRRGEVGGVLRDRARARGARARGRRRSPRSPAPRRRRRAGSGSCPSGASRAARGSSGPESGPRSRRECPSPRARPGPCGRTANGSRRRASWRSPGLGAADSAPSTHTTNESRATTTRARRPALLSSRPPSGARGSRDGAGRTGLRADEGRAEGARCGPALRAAQRARRAAQRDEEGRLRDARRRRRHGGVAPAREAARGEHRGVREGRAGRPRGGRARREGA